VPFIKRYVPKKNLAAAGILLWLIFLLGLFYRRGEPGALTELLEFAGMNWFGVLFLLFGFFLFIDVITLFGLLFRKIVLTLRGIALIAGFLLSIIAFIQGNRIPVVNKYEVTLPGLPEQMNGTVIVVVSDLHLCPQFGKGWLESRLALAKEQKPDIIVLLGDIFEGRGLSASPFIEVFNSFSVPLGVFGVLGNHEFYGGNKSALFEKSGIKLLRDKWVEICPGLVLAGVDDLTIRRRIGIESGAIEKALNGRPPGAAILLSHSPLYAEKAAEAGAELMLSAHTHGGQIWPFNYLVKRSYPLLEGRYEVNGMTVIVSRGTGTWGPRMRLRQRGDILKIKLKSPN